MKTHYQFFLAIFIAFAAVILYIASKLGAFLSLEDVNNTNCVLLFQPVNTPGSSLPVHQILDGAEDLTRFDDHIFVSADPYRMHMMDPEVAQRRRGPDYPKYDQLKDWRVRLSDMTREEQGKIVVATASELQHCINRPEDCACTAKTRDDMSASSAMKCARNGLFREVQMVNWDWNTRPDFHPHGIHIMRSNSGTAYIGVVLHGRDGDSVALFQLEQMVTDETKEVQWAMTLIQEFRSNVLLNANDVTVVDSIAYPGQVEVYGTNFYATPNENLLGILGEAVTMVRWGSVFRCRVNAGCSIVIDHMGQPNGIQARHVTGESGTYIQLIVAGFLDGEIMVYSVKDDTVKLEQSIPVAIGLDNIELVNQGSGKPSILVAAHRQPYRVILSQKNPTHRAPNSVFEMSDDGERLAMTSRPHLVYQDHNPAKLGAISVAAELSSANSSTPRMVIMGSPFEAGLLACRV